MRNLIHNIADDVTNEAIIALRKKASEVNLQVGSKDLDLAARVYRKVARNLSLMAKAWPEAESMLEKMYDAVEQKENV
jgi:hypothetical protein